MSSAEPPNYFYFAFALAVWIIYTLDHLFDSLKRQELSSSLRYWIHFKYRGLIISIMAVFAVAVLYIVLSFFKKDDIIISLVFGFLVLFYFLVVLLNKNKTKTLQKEILVAFFYTVGIWGYPLLFSKVIFPVWYFLLMLSFFLIAISVLLSYSIIDERFDVADNQNTFVVLYGVRKAISLIYILSVTNFMLLISIFFFFPIRGVLCFAIILCIMIASNLFLFSMRKRLENISWYKIFGELIFFIPIIYFL